MNKMKYSQLENKDIYIGLEDSKRTWKLSCRCEGREVFYTSMPTDYNGLRRFVSTTFPSCRITFIYEAGFKGFGLHDRLVEDGYKCIVTPPHLVSGIKNKRVKTDKIDARRLARNLENGDYISCNVPDRERREDRQYSRTLIGIQKDIVVVRNRIRKMLEFHGIAVSLHEGSWYQSDIAVLTDLVLPKPLRMCLDILLMQLEQLWAIKKNLRRMLRALTQKERYAHSFKLIQSVPGVGWFTAIRLVLEWGEDAAQTFSSSKKFASFNGLVVSEHSSGETVRRGSITKTGRKFLRSWLVECAWMSIKKDPALFDKYNRIWKGSGSKKKAIVAVARTLTGRIRECLLHNHQYVVGIVQ